MPSIGAANAVISARRFSAFLLTLPETDRPIAREIYRLADAPSGAVVWGYAATLAFAVSAMIIETHFKLPGWAVFAGWLAAMVLFVVLIVLPMRRRRQTEAKRFMDRHPSLTARVREVVESV